MKFNHKRPLRLIACVSLLALAVALIAQYVFAVQPCAWCVLQRLLYLVIAVVTWIGAYGGRTAARIVAALTALLAIAGMAAAWYQLTVASKMLSCAQTYADWIISSTHLDVALPWLFGVYASCMDAAGSLLGVDYAIWSLGLFAILFIFNLPVLVGRR
jgi:disulfide bond formation protein DsbB